MAKTKVTGQKIGSISIPTKETYKHGAQTKQKTWQSTVTQLEGGQVQFVAPNETKAKTFLNMGEAESYLKNLGGSINLSDKPQNITKSYDGGSVTYGGKTYATQAAAQAAQQRAESQQAQLAGGEAGKEAKEAAIQAREKGPEAVVDSDYYPEDTGMTKSESEYISNIQGMLADYQQAQSSFKEALDSQMESFNNSFKAIQTMMGEQTNAFQQQMEAVQKQTGMVVDTQDPKLLEAIKEAQATGQEDYTEILQKHLVTPDQVRKRVELEGLSGLAEKAVAGGLDPAKAQEAIKAFEESSFYVKEGAEDMANYFKKWIPEEEEPATVEGLKTPTTKKPEATLTSPEQEANYTLDQITGTSTDALFQNLEGMGYDLSGATSMELLYSLLAEQGLKAANDDTVKNYLLQGVETAKKTFEDTMAIYGPGGTVIQEMDAILSDEDVTPTTYESLAVKMYDDAKDYQLASIDAEKSYRQTQYDLWNKGEQEKRGRLEGYLKAKLYAAGAQDSSAGLAVMSLQVNAADLKMLMSKNEHEYGMSKLNIQASKVMTDFTNNVTKAMLDADTKASEAMTDYDEKVYKIQGLLIEDDKEKKKLMLDTLSNYTDKLYKIDQDKKAQQRWAYEQAQQDTQNAISNAFKLSGMTGYLHAPDENGYIVPVLGKDGKQIPTQATKQWEETNLRAWMNYEVNAKYASWAEAKNLIAAGKYEAAGMAMGQGADYFLDLKNKNDMLDRIDLMDKQSTLMGKILPAIAAENGVMASIYNDGYKPDADGFQCGEFVHKFLTDYPYGLDTLEQKKGEMNSQIPKVGAAVITNESFPGKNTGHIAMINAITPDGYLILTEANANGDGKVTNTRKMAITDPKIQGYFHGTLKPEIQAFTKSVEKFNVDKYVAQYKDGVPKNEIISLIKDVTVDTTEQAELLQAFDDAIKVKKPTYVDIGKLIPFITGDTGIKWPGKPGKSLYEQYSSEEEFDLDSEIDEEKKKTG